MIPFIKTKKKVILDTNMLLQPGKGVDVLHIIDSVLHESFEFCVMERTYEELENIVKTAKKGSDKFNAKLGIIMAKQKGLKTLTSSINHVDDAIMDVISANDYVATLDKALQKRVQAKGAKFIAVKNKNQVIIR